MARAASTTATALDQRRVLLEPEDLLSNTCELAAVGILCFLAAPHHASPRFAFSPSLDSEGVVELTAEQGQQDSEQEAGDEVSDDPYAYYQEGEEDGGA